MSFSEPPSLVGHPDVAELYKRYGSWLGAMVRRLGGAEATDDIVHETYLHVAGLPVDVDLRRPQGLLLRIAQNILRDRARNAGRRGRPAFTQALAFHQPDVIGAAQYEAVLLKQIIASLPASYRDIFVLSRFGDQSYEEIARSQGLTVKAVERRMARAMALCTARMRD